MASEPKDKASGSPGRGPIVTALQTLVCLFFITAAMVSAINPPPDGNGRALAVAGVILFGLPGAAGLYFLFRRWQRER
jgi:hypothetical protein